jgi:carbon storage regulator
MLVLKRKACERIQIGESIVVTVVRIEGNAVRLGIEAPSNVAVYRQELLRQPPLCMVVSQEKPV